MVRLLGVVWYVPPSRKKSHFTIQVSWKVLIFNANKTKWDTIKGNKPRLFGHNVNDIYIYKLEKYVYRIILL